MYKNAALSSKVFTADDIHELEKTLFFSVQNKGTSEVYVGLNEGANTNITLLAGEGISFRATAGTIYHKQTINIGFGASGTNKCVINTERLGIDVTQEVCG